MPRQSELRFSFKSLAGKAAFEVVSFTLEEGISTPFKLSLELASEDGNIEFGELLDQPGLFTLWDGEQPVRYVHGVVSTFSQGETVFFRTRYKAVIEPLLARAALRSNWRIFQHKTVPQILEMVLREQPLTAFDLHICTEHQPREYCVQAGETDLQFIARLAAEEGITYGFTHSEDSHRLIVTDRLPSMGRIAHEQAPGDFNDPANHDSRQTPTVLYQHMPGADQPAPCLWQFRYTEHVRSARQVQRDYTFKNPAYRLEHSAGASQLKHQSAAYERFDYPGRYKRDAAGKPFTQTRIATLRNDARVGSVQGDDARLQPGKAFNLIGHPRDDLNTYWRVLSIVHQGTQPTSLYEEAGEATEGITYVQDAVLVPGHLDWKSELLPRPRIDGPQMATVVGPATEEIYCDEWGRVKLSFPWDRLSGQNEFSSCWVRVSQGWAGTYWGAMAIPRVGQEVIVSYVDGDPDQPIVTGRTYCGNEPPPYELPKHKTRMTIKSKTHKGKGFNELRFEDEQGIEEVFIHAQKDQNNHVKHNETTFVGNDRSERVEHDETIAIGNDRTETVGRDEGVSIGQDQQHSIGRDAVLHIGRNQHVSTVMDRIESVGNNRRDNTTANHWVDIGGHQEQNVEGHAQLQAGQAITHRTQVYEIQACESLVIKSPGGSLRLDASGITLDGVAIHIKGPVNQQANGGSHELTVEGAPVPGEAVCVSCLMKAIKEGRNLVPMASGKA